LPTNESDGAVENNNDSNNKNEKFQTPALVLHK